MKFIIVKGVCTESRRIDLILVCLRPEKLKSNFFIFTK
jgi:hypothetical protein